MDRLPLRGGGLPATSPTDGAGDNPVVQNPLAARRRGDLFGGDELPFLGNLRDNSAAFVELRWSY